MFHILTCNGYVAEDSTDDLDRAVELCAQRADMAGDGFGRVVLDASNGQLVADEDGIWPESGLSKYERQEACFGEQP
jgi:hypothetical protein